MSVCLSVSPYQLGSHRREVREVWYWKLLLNSVEKIQIWLKSDKNTGLLYEDLNSFYIVANDICRSTTQIEVNVDFPWEHSIFRIVDRDVRSETIQIEVTVGFPWQQWLCKCAMMLRYIYTVPVLVWIVSRSISSSCEGGLHPTDMKQY
jgi:hypothetical protein